jgi:hypothetical protein
MSLLILDYECFYSIITFIVSPLQTNVTVHMTLTAFTN